jgi:CRP-like cAMP-binding protein
MMKAVMVGPSVKLAHLRVTPPFSGLPDDALDTAANMADEVAVPTGFVLVYEGDWGDEVFVIAEGNAAVLVEGQRVDTLVAGALFGGIGASEPLPAGSTVVAASPMRFFVFDSDGFRDLLDDHPSLVERAGNATTRLTA